MATLLEKNGREAGHSTTAADRVLTVAGARLRYREAGAGPALLLIHGWTLDLDMWESQARELCDSFRVIRHDRRGFGLSTGCPSLADDVADVFALCEHLRVRSVALLGMSQGARVAAHVAAKRPELVSHVIFDGAPAGVVLEDPEPQNDIPIAQYRQLARSRELTEFRRAWSQHPLTRLHTQDGPTRQLLQRMLERYRAEDLQLSTAEAPAPSPSPQPAAIRAPALVISGALDLESRIRAAEALAQALPSNRRAVIPAAGHMPNLDNPQTYNIELRKFLQPDTR